MVRTSESDLFTAQMRLLHRFAAESATLEKAVARHGRKVKNAAESASDSESHPFLVQCAAQVCELEQEWEELQESYNRQSESVEEEFLARIADLESDLELPPELQTALEAEAESFLGTLERIHEALTDLGSAVDLAISRSSSRFLNLRAGSSMSPRAQVSILLVSLALGAILGRISGVSLAGILLTLTPPVLAMILLSVKTLRR
jgi:chromosome segregation ATPase